MIRESTENYLETIYILSQRMKDVRSIDVCNELGYSKPTISVAMKQFREKKLIEMDGSGYITLTPAGLEIALRSKSRVNMVILGAIIKAAGFIPLQAAADLIEDTLGKKYPSMLKNNLEGLNLGYEECRIQHFSPNGLYAPVPYTEVNSPWGYANAPLGGANPHIGSTVSNDLSPSREGYIPLFLPEKCIHCGLCDTTCPDMVFQFLPGTYRGRPSMLNSGLDYHHCKGCLRCVDVCPTGALVAGKEREHLDKQWFVRNKDLIAEHMDFEPAGADPWVTSESYLDEKRVDGGLM